jgi:nitrate reductase NapE
MHRQPGSETLFLTQDDGHAAGVNRVPQAQRRKELLAFFVLAFGIWPIMAIGVVGGYGSLVWLWQIVNCPPGPPAG